MCNRFKIEHPEHVHLWSKKMLHWEWVDLVLYLNAAPTNKTPVVFLDEAGDPHGELMEWGVRFKEGGPPYMNAQKEKAFGIWKDGVQSRRCAVLADGFFEWPPDPEPKRPWLIRRKGNVPFAFAGIYTSPRSDGTRTYSFLTTIPNEMTAAIHHPRSPVILDETTVHRWIRPGPISKDELEAIATPYPGEKMEMFRVTKRMGNSRYKEADAAKPMTPEEIAAEDGKTKIVSVEKSDGNQLSLL